MKKCNYRLALFFGSLAIEIERRICKLHVIAAAEQELAEWVCGSAARA